jgi:pilus assembly protein CpaC
MRITGQRAWAAACGAQMFILGVFGTPHRTLAQQIVPGPTAPAAMASNAGAVDTASEPSSVQLIVGRSTLVDVGAPIQRVSLTSADIADALVTGSNQLLVHGKTPGSISMFVWSRAGGVKRYEIVVSRDLARLSDQMQLLFPGEEIQVHANGKQIVLSGTASRKEVADKAIEVAAGYAASKADVVSLLQAQPGAGSSQVLLRVRFAEVDRSALTQFGASWFTSPTGIKNVVGRVTTQQYSAPEFDKLEWTKASGDWGADVTSAKGEFKFGDFLNLFFLHEKYDLGTVIKALQTRGLFQSLAEPNLVAESGKEASFLAGGEFPIPIAQGSGANIGVSVQFKEFGVRLNFTPTVNGDRVHLKVRPEVSTLDFGNAVVLNGFRIPALSTRRAETSLELRNGQTFAIAGLMNNTLQTTISKIPGIGDIPILGQLFKSRAHQKDQTELVVMITPEILPADSPGVTRNLPRYPETFMPPVSDQQMKPPPPPAFPPSARSTGAVATPAPGQTAAAPSVDERNAIERAQDRAAQSQGVAAAQAHSLAPAPAETPQALPPQPERVSMTPKERADEHWEAGLREEGRSKEQKKLAKEQKRLDALMKEQAKREAEAAEKAQKEEARRAEAEQKLAEKQAKEQAKRDAEAAKAQERAGKEKARADRQASTDTRKAEEDAQRQAAAQAEQQRALDAAAARLKQAEADYQAELARRSGER